MVVAIVAVLSALSVVDAFHFSSAASSFSVNAAASMTLSPKSRIPQVGSVCRRQAALRLSGGEDSEYMVNRSMQSRKLNLFTQHFESPAACHCHSESVHTNRWIRLRMLYEFYWWHWPLVCTRTLSTLHTHAYCIPSPLAFLAVLVCFRLMG